MRIKHILSAAIAMVALCACDEHREWPDTTMKTCDILCTDGDVVRCEDLESLGKTPIAVVFHINQEEQIEGTGYAVYLWDLPAIAFSDSLGSKQGTSANPLAFDGNTNTFAMFVSGSSPAAQSVFDMWYYGQSAFIPSLSELQLLYVVRDQINPYIRRCGGNEIPDDADQCWYWTSTEVYGQETAKAWLFSLASGAMQETPKGQLHKVRPIITLYN